MQQQVIVNQMWQITKNGLVWKLVNHHSSARFLFFSGEQHIAKHYISYVPITGSIWARTKKNKYRKDFFFLVFILSFKAKFRETTQNIES